MNQATAAERSNKKLNRHINRWARKNKLSVVRVGYPATGCTKGAALAVCMARRQSALRLKRRCQGAVT